MLPERAAARGISKGKEQKTGGRQGQGEPRSGGQSGAAALGSGRVAGTGAGGSTSGSGGRGRRRGRRGGIAVSGNVGVCGVGRRLGGGWRQGDCVWSLVLRAVHGCVTGIWRAKRVVAVNTTAASICDEDP